MKTIGLHLTIHEHVRVMIQGVVLVTEEDEQIREDRLVRAAVAKQVREVVRVEDVLFPRQGVVLVTNVRWRRGKT